MRASSPLLAMLPPALLLAAGPAPAAELLPPLTLHTAGIAATPSPGSTSPPGATADCPALAPPTGTVHPGQLAIRESLRPDVGPFTVRLPGYGTGPASGARDSYRPYLVTAAPGDTLRFDLVNQLSPGLGYAGLVNLHTHGLVTSPRPCTPLGDYVFVEDRPGTTTSYRVDIPATLPGTMYGSSPTPQTYPSGLNWFHAHVHGKNAEDIQAGQSGLMYVGDLEHDLLAAPGIDPASTAALAQSDVQYLGLRDIQLAVPQGVTPDNAAPGQQAQWLHGADYDPQACPAYANPPVPYPGGFSGPGYCGHHGATVGGAASAAQDTVWLYTVNGQQGPTLTMQPGRNQVWRIANLSSDATYVLELDDDATGAPEMLDALSLDGVAAGTSVAGQGTLQVGVPVAQVLLMPASRAEVLVLNAGGTAGRHLTLRTTGITTGASGSRWPRIDLARVTMPPAATQSALAPASVAAMRMSLPMMAPSAVATTAQAGAPAPVNCITLPAGRVTRRRITFAVDRTGKSYQLGSEVVDQYGRPIDALHTIAPQAFPMQSMLSPTAVPHVCARLGSREVWEIVNLTGELHNFHVHENKFRLSTQTDAGVPPNLVAFQDPAGLVAQYQPQTGTASSTETVDVWHDVFPLPPYGGRIFVTIPFVAPQQVGSFVYHCHILEHEDAGMMAPMQVYDPASLASSDPAAPVDVAALIRGAICRAPADAATPASLLGRLATGLGAVAPWLAGEGAGISASLHGIDME